MSIFLNVMGGLGIFLIGMKMMSDSIQKSSGEKLHKMLNILTGNRVFAVFTGLAATIAVQSSSATTVMLVSLVNAGLVNLTQAVGVVMGANIGTTMTAWLVSLGMGKFKIISIALPSIAIGLPLYFSKKEKLNNIAGILIGFGILFIGLNVMKESVEVLKDRPEIFAPVRFVESLGWFKYIIGITFGTLLTIMVQSSSAAMALTISFLGFGYISFDIAAAIVLGENIGTTITAYLASLQMNIAAKRAARAHMIFNLFGVTWMLLIISFFPLLDGIKNIMSAIFGFDKSDPNNIRWFLSAFHTFFNITNTLLLIWFIPFIVKTVKKLIPESEEEVSGPYRIPFIRQNIADLAEVNLISARTEVGKMSQLTSNIVMELKDVIGADPEELTKISKNIQKKETRTDEMQEQLSGVLAEISLENLTEKQALEVSSLLRIVNELESIADSGLKITELYRTKAKKGFAFHENSNEEIENYSNKVMNFLKFNTDYLNKTQENQDFNAARDMEDAINDKRKKLTKRSRKNIQKGGDLRGELLYMEIVRQLEHIGDFCLNISESISKYS